MRFSRVVARFKYYDINHRRSYALFNYIAVLSGLSTNVSLIIARSWLYNCNTHNFTFD